MDTHLGYTLAYRFTIAKITALSRFKKGQPARAL